MQQNWSSPMVALNDFIQIHENVIDEDTCDFLIQLFEQNPEYCENEEGQSYSQFNLTEVRELSEEVNKIHNDLIRNVYKHRDEYYDVYLCNPPFNTNDEKQIFVQFFCKILMHMKDDATLYFICPKMFYKNQNKIKIEYEIINRFTLLDYIKENNDMPANYYYNKYGVIELDSDGFRFNHAMLKRIKSKGIIDDDFISDENFMINPYFEFRYLGNIFDFQHTKMQAGLFKVNK